MAIYVMSDIHGQKALFDKMLKQINFSKDDELYVLGDVIDRGPHPIKLLLKVMRTPNIHFLMGNHEFMMREFHKSQNYEDFAIWIRNGGKATLDELKSYKDITIKRIYKYLDTLPVEMRVTVNGQEYILCHAQPHPLSFKKDPFDSYSIGYKYISDEEFSVWQRCTYPTKEHPEKELGIIPDDNFKNKVIIFGHTPVYNYDGWNGINEIKKVDNTINIDCGCAAIIYDNNKLNGRLACLRLDDNAVFYEEP